MRNDSGGINLIQVIISFLIISIVSLAIIGHSYYATTQLKNEIIAKQANQLLYSYTEELNGRLKNDILSAQEMTGGRREIILYEKRNKVVEGLLRYNPIQIINVPETTDEIDWFVIKTNVEWKDLFGRNRIIEYKTIQSFY